eukprot:CAMPEP_0204533826 /NCGR_PEP_ID=MMETSP0661-20131031/12515_1 /ASSEMBLY_ACC=CAM_ASM_000606 /TAXON_ID=109239 /ORGANISM="Alexandrium margalefi, Strain AMGDE01CS-322" /LENGTH=116 /DNA_ID=CAMNT_0051540225 /DNA_START=103 /DNA_END=453 /DNA_ORIENTATION=-
MGDADVRLTTVSRDGAQLGKLIPAGSMTKQEGKSALAGKWTLPGVDGSVTLEVTGSSVKSLECPFGNQPLMGEIEESEEMLGLHVTMGGFPMKAWLKQEGGSTVLAFSNGGRWQKL